ncbi:MAG: methyltransferase [Bacilli bacterium]
MSQYFDNDQDVKNKDILVNYTFAGSNFSLMSNNGIFSKSKLDDGSRVLLKAITKIPHKGKILDLGCGIGVIGLTDCIINKEESFYTLVDINKTAVTLATNNAARLHCENKVEVLYSDIFSAIDDKKFNYVLLNPPIRAGKSVIYKMFSDSFIHLIDGGSLIIVIRKSHGAESASKYLSSIYSCVSLIYREHGYYVYEAKK